MEKVEIKIEMIKNAINNLMKLKDEGLIRKELADPKLDELLKQLSELMKMRK